jgi:hypothetical protein
LHHIPSPFCFSYFLLIGSCICAWPARTELFLFIFPTPTTPSFYELRWGLMNYLPGLAWNQGSTDLCLQSSWNTGVINCALLKLAHFN